MILILSAYMHDGYVGSIYRVDPLLSFGHSLVHHT